MRFPFGTNLSRVGFEIHFLSPTSQKKGKDFTQKRRHSCFCRNRDVLCHSLQRTRLLLSTKRTKGELWFLCRRSAEVKMANDADISPLSSQTICPDQTGTRSRRWAPRLFAVCAALISKGPLSIMQDCWSCNTLEM